MQWSSPLASITTMQVEPSLAFIIVRTETGRTAYSTETCESQTRARSKTSLHNIQQQSPHLSQQYALLVGFRPLQPEIQPAAPPLASHPPCTPSARETASGTTTQNPFPRVQTARLPTIPFKSDSGGHPRQKCSFTRSSHLRSSLPHADHTICPACQCPLLQYLGCTRSKCRGVCQKLLFNMLLSQ